MNKRQIMSVFLPVIAIILSGFFILKFGDIEYYFRKDKQITEKKIESSAKQQTATNYNNSQKLENRQEELAIKISSTKSDRYGSDGVISQTTSDEPKVRVDVFAWEEGASKIEIFQAGKKELLDFLVYDKEKKPIGKKIDTKNLTLVSALEGKELNMDFDGDVIIPDEGAGIWLIKVTVGEKSKEAFVVRSNFGAIVKNGSDEMVFWAQKFQTKKRLSGAKIEVYSFLDKADRLDSAETDTDGVAKTKIIEKADVAFLEKDGELAVIPINMRYIGMENYGGFVPEKTKKDYFVFTDRPIYQPGDKIYFKAVIRNEKDVRFSIPSGDASVEIISSDNFGQENAKSIFSKKIRISENGTIAGDFIMPETAKAGEYYLTVKIGNSDEGEPGFWWFNSIGRAIFSVEHYQKPEYDIAVSTAKDEIVSGDELTFNISGNYFSGQPLKGKAVKYKIYSSRIYDNAYYFSDYQRYNKNEYRYGYMSGALVGEGTADLDEFGASEVKLDKDETAQFRANGKNAGDIGYDRIFSIEIEYADDSGIPVYDSQNVFVQAGLFSIFRDGERHYGYTVGDDIALDLLLHSPVNSKVDNVGLEGKIKLNTWKKIFISEKNRYRYENEKHELEQVLMKTDSSGKATLKFKAEKAGSYDISVTAVDERGNKVERKIYVWVSERDGFYWNEKEYTGLKIQGDKEEYQPNDTARLTISSDLPDRDVFLSFDRAGLDRYKVVHLSGNSTQVDMPLAGTDVPNIFAAVSSFSDQKLDASNINLRIATDEKRIDVSFAADKDKYSPGDEVKLQLETKDGRGNAVAAETAVWLVDKAIYELAINNSTGIFDKFWFERYNDTSENHSLMDISIYPGAEKGGGGGDGGRTVFKDTAFWKADVMTDRSGKANINFKLPDNLTTWVVAGISANQNTQVGEGKSEILVTKDVIARPILPNILRVDDSIKISSLVHNFTDKNLNFNVDLKADGVKILNPETQKTGIKSQEERQFFWQVIPQAESDSLKMTFSAVADDKKNVEIITKEIPVRKFGFWGRTVDVGNDESKEFKLSLAKDTDTEKATINFSIAPTLLGALPEAMKYLVDYPYGCVEQTTSRFVPAVIAKKNQDLFRSSIPDKKINEIINKGITHLFELQNNDGGWGWSGGNSDPFITAYVVEYLVEARKLGFIVDAARMQDAQEFLESENNYTDKIKRDENVSKVYALSLLDRNSEKGKEKLEDFNDITPDILALAVMANIRNGYKDASTNGLQELLNMAKPEGEGLFWPTGASYYFGSDDASTALAIRAIVMANQNRDMAVRGVRFLTMERKSNYWSNTFATAHAIRALVDFSEKAEKINPKYNYSLILDGEEIGKGSITKYNQLDNISIPVSRIKSNGSILTIKKAGEGDIYSTLDIKEYHTDKNSPAFSSGLNVKREYMNLTNPGQYLHVGDEVEVVITLSGLQNKHDYAVIEDELPAGLVPINLNLKNEQANENDNQYDYYDYSQKEITENGAIFNIYRLNIWDNVYSYKARVISEGEFTVPPARAEIMYAPEINGRSEAQKVIVDNNLVNEVGENEKVDENESSEPKISRELDGSNGPARGSVVKKSVKLKLYIQGLLWRVQNAWEESSFVVRSIFYFVVWGSSSLLIVYYLFQKSKQEND